MKVDWYELLSRCVEEGLMGCVRRAYRHTEEDPPSNERERRIREEAYEGIMAALSEVIIWEDRYAECPLRGELALGPQDYRYDLVPHDHEWTPH